MRCDETELELREQGLKRPRSSGTGLAMGRGREGMTRWRRKRVDCQSGGGTGWIEPIQIPVRDDLIDLLSLPYKTDNNKIPISPNSLDHQRTNEIENRRDCARCTTASSASQTRSVDAISIGTTAIMHAS